MSFTFWISIIKINLNLLRCTCKHVHTHTVCKHPCRLSTRVPQGLVFGPSLFSLYTQSHGEVKSHVRIRHHCYADDTHFIVSFPPSACMADISSYCRWQLIRCILISLKPNCCASGELSLSGLSSWITVSVTALNLAKTPAFFFHIDNLHIFALVDLSFKSSEELIYFSPHEPLQHHTRCLFSPLLLQDWTTATHSWQVCLCTPFILCSRSRMQLHVSVLTFPNSSTTPYFSVPCTGFL